MSQSFLIIFHTIIIRLEDAQTAKREDRLISPHFGLTLSLVHTLSLTTATLTFTIFLVLLRNKVLITFLTIENNLNQFLPISMQLCRKRFYVVHLFSLHWYHSKNTRQLWCFFLVSMHHKYVMIKLM